MNESRDDHIGYPERATGNTHETEMTSRDYIRVLFRHKRVVFMTILTVISTAITGVILKTPVYQARVKMLITGQKRTQADYYSDIGIGGMRSLQIAQTQSEIVTSDPVIERAVSVLGLAKKPFDYEKRFCFRLKKPIIEWQVRNIEKKLEKLSKEQKEAILFRMAMEDLRKRLKVEPIRDTDLFLIKVKDFNPLGAAVTANVVSRSYTIFDLEQQLAEMKLKFGEKHQAVIQLKKAIEKMSKNLNGAPLSPIDAIGPATVKIIEQAKVPLKPIGISHVLTVILAFFMSLFLSVLLAFIFEYMDQTFKSPSEVEFFLGIDCLGSLPRKAKSDDYHELSEQLYLAIKDKGAKSLVFTSAMPREGVTQLISNLGTYIAKNFYKKVLLIDGNLRNPALHEMFKLPESKNFLNVIGSKITLERGVKKISPNLHVLTSGSLTEPKPSGMSKLSTLFREKSPILTSALNPVSILDSKIMKDFIKQVREDYDLVLIDSAPFREVKDAAIISTYMDGVIVVVNERKTRRHVVKHALGSLKARKANLIGVVLNNRKYVIPGFIYNRI